MTNAFLGAGSSFPLRLNAEGQIDSTQDEDKVRQSIWIILSTARGERVMRPDFGCGIYDLVFSPNRPGTAGQASREVRRALLQWEPRIDVLEVQALPDTEQPSRLLIAIRYQVRSTSNEFNLVYPFYLE